MKISKEIDSKHDLIIGGTQLDESYTRFIKLKSYKEDTGYDTFIDIQFSKEKM